MTAVRKLTIFGALAVHLVGAPAFGEVASDAGEAEDPLARGRQLVRSFDFRAAATELEGVADDETVAPSARIAALELLGALHFDRRRRPQAREAFERLLALDPGHELVDPEIPPRVREFFQELREATDFESATTLEASAPGEVPASGPVRIQATVGGEAAGLEQVVAFIRSDGVGQFNTVVMTGAVPEFEAHVDAIAAGEGLSYYVEVHAPSGFVLATAGTEAEPLRIEANAAVAAAALIDTSIEPGALPEEPRAVGGWYTSWWFWTIVGVVVAGGTTAAVVLTLPEPHETGSLGSVHMP